MPVAIITGAGGLIGSEAVDPSSARASTWSASRTTCGPASSARVLDLARHPASGRGLPPQFRWENADIRDTADRPHLRRARRQDRARRPHRRAALARLGRERPADRLRRQRQRHPQPARGHPRPLPRRAVRLLLDQQGLRRHPQPAAAGEPGATARAAPGPPLLQGDRHDHVDRLLHPLAVRRLQGGGRPAGPGVRPLLRDADRLLPRRLPDRAAARRRQAARLPRLPDEVHRHRDALHRLRLRRQAGPRQPPQRRPDRGLRGVTARPARRRRLQHRRRARATARCSRRSRPASGSPAAG